MDWDPAALAAIGRAPSLLRGLARRRVEARVRESGGDRVTAADVADARRALHGRTEQMSPEEARFIEQEVSRLSRVEPIEGRWYSVRPCAGAVGCPRALAPVGDLARRVAAEIEASSLPAFAEETHRGPVLAHHRFSAAIAGCANACSQPQIQDFGLIAAAEVGVNPRLCDGCGECVSACREGAIALTKAGPVVDAARCIGCADCLRACPTQALLPRAVSYRVLVGGRLGRHPQLARELIPRADAEQAFAVLRAALELIPRAGRAGERLGSLLARTGLAPLRSDAKNIVTT